jgi:hypothetical protein
MTETTRNHNEHHHHHCCDPINLKPGLFYFAFFDAVWMWSSWVTKAAGAAA